MSFYVHIIQQFLQCFTYTQHVELMDILTNYNTFNYMTMYYYYINMFDEITHLETVTNDKTALHINILFKNLHTYKNTQR